MLVGSPCGESVRMSAPQEAGNISWSQRHLLLGKKAMTNLDIILKSREVTLPTKVHLVKAVVFPVLMYGCKNWAIQKDERGRIDALNCGAGELLRVPWTARRSTDQF